MSYGINLVQDTKNNGVFNYEQFRELKFLIRRSVFLENYKIIQKDFLELLFNQVSKFLKKETKDDNKNDLFGEYKKQLKSFSLFLVVNYKELIQKNKWVGVKLLNNFKEITLNTTTNELYQFTRMINIELFSLFNDFYNILHNDKNWKNIYKKSEGIEYDTDKIKTFLTLTNNNFDKRNDFQLIQHIYKSYINSNQQFKKNQQFLNFLWIKQFIRTDADKHLNDYNVKSRTNAILEKIKKLFINEIGLFFIVNDGKNKPHLIYDKNENNIPQIYDLDNKKLFPITLKFLEGEKIENQTKHIKNAYKTIQEFEINNIGKWTDIYTNVSLNGDKYLLQGNVMLLRIIDKQFNPLGILGVYSSNVEFKKDNFGKNLLISLLGDVGDYIIKHYRNDEFSDLREAETVKRFAYLAGHGRQMMQNLASHSNSNNSLSIKQIVATMEKLQYLYATKWYNFKEKEFIDLFPIESIEVSKLVREMKDLAKKIFESKYVENKIEFEIEEVETPKNNFNFNENIIKFLYFELIINAKKNRFHFISKNDDSKLDRKNKNSFKIDFEINNDEMVILVSGTGSKIPERIKDKINSQKQIKENSEISGLYLISKVIQKFNNDNCIQIKSERHHSHTEEYPLYMNTVSITIKNPKSKDETTDNK